MNLSFWLKFSDTVFCKKLFVVHRGFFTLYFTTYFIKKDIPGYATKTTDFTPRLLGLMLLEQWYIRMLTGTSSILKVVLMFIPLRGLYYLQYEVYHYFDNPLVISFSHFPHKTHRYGFLSVRIFLIHKNSPSANFGEEVASDKIIDYS